MKLGKLSEFEISMIKLIARYHPYGELEVETVYRVNESYDETIAALEWAFANAEYPQEYHLKLSK